MKCQLTMYWREIKCHFLRIPLPPVKIMSHVFPGCSQTTGFSHFPSGFATAAGEGGGTWSISAVPGEHTVCIKQISPLKTHKHACHISSPCLAFLALMDVGRADKHICFIIWHHKQRAVHQCDVPSRQCFQHLIIIPNAKVREFWHPEDTNVWALDFSPPNKHRPVVSPPAEMRNDVVTVHF